MPHPPTQTAPTQPLTALVVDDHPLFCDALALTLRSISPFRDIRTADTLRAALDRLDGDGPVDMVFLDLNLPDVQGLDGLTRLRAAAPDSRVLVVSSMADNRVIAGALRAGAAGFVTKHAQRAVFRDAIETVMSGATYTPDSFVPPAGDTDAPDAVSRLAALTNQQARILQLICAGKLNKQIAYDLSIAETTVKAHVTAIMRKLGVQSRTQAVLVAQQASFAKVLPSGR